VYNVANGICFTSKLTVGGPREVKQILFATLYTRPPDDGRQMSQKHVAMK
jgi:hypothetical protein